MCLLLIEHRTQHLGLDRIEDLAHRRIARHPFDAVDPLQVVFGSFFVKGQQGGALSENMAKAAIRASARGMSGVP